MVDEQRARNVQLDLNNEEFQDSWLGLEKSERERVTDTFRKLRQLTWEQVYRDPGLKWGKGRKHQAPAGNRCDLHASHHQVAQGDRISPG